MNRKYIGFYVVTGVVILSVLTLLVSKYYFDWFKPETSKYAMYKQEADKADIENIKLEDNLQKEENSADVAKEEVPAEKTVVAKAVKEPAVVRKPIPATPLPPQKHTKNIEKTERNGEKTSEVEEKAFVAEDIRIKEINIDMNQQNFHSLGEYVSAEELQYRSELIGKLTINTIVIDKLSKGNGISQEFFRVAYVEKMIPSKVLRDIVESKEFRDLIPAQYLNNEGKTAKVLSSGEKVTFNAFAIKNLLELWSEGKLTPVQKAWLVGADGRTLD